MTSSMFLIGKVCDVGGRDYNAIYSSVINLISHVLSRSNFELFFYRVWFNIVVHKNILKLPIFYIPYFSANKGVYYHTKYFKSALLYSAVYLFCFISEMLAPLFLSQLNIPQDHAVSMVTFYLKV